MRITAAVSRPGLPEPRPRATRTRGAASRRDARRIVAVGICHTDLHEHPGRHSPQPIVLGHEGAGVVEAFGEGVRGLRAIMSSSVLLAGQCSRAASTAGPTYCDLAMPAGVLAASGSMDRRRSAAAMKASTSHFFGQSSFATHSIVPERTAVKVDKSPAAGDARAAGLWRHHRRRWVIEALKVGYGDSIAIFGTGGVGLSAVMAARLVGAKQIVAVDINRRASIWRC